MRVLVTGASGGLAVMRNYWVIFQMLRRSSSWSTDPVISASNRFQPIVAPPQRGRSVLRGSMGHCMVECKARSAGRGVRNCLRKGEFK